MELLSLNSCRLSSLKNFPNLPSLVKVELADNQLKGSDLAFLVDSTNIESIKLGANKIASVDDIKKLAPLSKLKRLDLVGNPVCDSDDYKRDAIYESIPSLEVLDMLDKEGEEVFSGEDSEIEDYGNEEYGEEEISEQLNGEQLEYDEEGESEVEGPESENEEDEGGEKRAKNN